MRRSLGSRTSVYGQWSTVYRLQFTGRHRSVRYGLSIIELLTVLTIVGTFMAIAIPQSLKTLDRITVRAAAGDLAMTLSSARELAIANRSSIAVDFNSPAGVRVRRGSAVLFSRNIASAHGVELAHTRDSLSYGRLGLGLGAANLSIVVRRRAAAETVFVSRLGRVR